MKSMDEVADAMSSLYEEVLSNRMDLKKASELANIAGKRLKAEQLKLAREVFVADKGRTSPTFPSSGQLLAAGERQGERS